MYNFDTRWCPVTFQILEHLASHWWIFWILAPHWLISHVWEWVRVECSECSVSESEITTCPSYLVWALGTLSANLDNECCPFCESLKIGDLASFNPNWGSIYFASLKVRVKCWYFLCVLGDRLRVGWAIQQRAAHLVTTLTILSVTNITCHVRESFQWLSLPSFGII